ncbi:hypothetical protein KY316_01410 [Candidatus Woesearchaeota archaeon]|nr:hypothetical protein [Candidatus Woesearchaeota archaeon]
MHNPHDRTLKCTNCGRSIVHKDIRVCSNCGFKACMHCHSTIECTECKHKAMKKISLQK